MSGAQHRAGVQEKEGPWVGAGGPTAACTNDRQGVQSARAGPACRGPRLRDLALLGEGQGCLEMLSAQGGRLGTGTVGTEWDTETEGGVLPWPHGSWGELKYCRSSHGQGQLAPAPHTLETREALWVAGPTGSSRAPMSACLPGPPAGTHEWKGPDTLFPTQRPLSWAAVSKSLPPGAPGPHLSSGRVEAEHPAV
ncbi:hypothetical protein HJG60_008096 [Phyllostomus discolor]|uniref:Uncharacterized protein n=1 Tax=Phyllostomus discolor TaxID=89673 RepID=A0A834BP03_9CHIR|nr:hypothetical protein HJG60_008096 [Phyllostomus discolor]